MAEDFAKSHSFLVPMQFNRDREGAGGWVRKKGMAEIWVRGWIQKARKYYKIILLKSYLPFNVPIIKLLKF